jgi:hypothetical protein
MTEARGRAGDLPGGLRCRTVGDSVFQRVPKVPGLRSMETGLLLTPGRLTLSAYWPLIAQQQPRGSPGQFIQAMQTVDHNGQFIMGYDRNECRL